MRQKPNEAYFIRNYS